MDVKEKVTHPLVLKVMRLTKPTYATPVIVTCEPNDLVANHFEKKLKEDFTVINGAETITIGEFLLVPQNFGSIYLGEMFSCFICIHNHSKEAVENITLKVDLQTSSQRFMLIDDNDQKIIVPNDTYDQIIQHEVKEIGTHILVCEVIYNEGFTFRKFFKFQVLKPLDVKTKFYVSESDEVYVEAEVQNTTAGPICYETIKLKTSENFSVTDLNEIKSNQSVFGDINMVEKDVSRQYLYCLSPVSKEPLLPNDALNIGIIDIIWRSNLGDRGHLQTSNLQTMRSQRDNVTLSVVESPSVVQLNSVFRFTCKITNCSESELELLLVLEDVENLIWCAKSNILLDKLCPMQSVLVQLQSIPVVSGIQDIGGIKLMDVDLHYDYTFDNVAQVFVL